MCGYCGIVDNGGIPDRLATKKVLPGSILWAATTVGLCIYRSIGDTREVRMDETISRREFIRVVEVGGVTITLAGCQGLQLDDLGTELTDTTMQESQQQDTDRDGPMKTGRLVVTIDEAEVPDWQSVTIPTGYVANTESREGSDATYEKKLWGQVSFDDLEMERRFKPGATELHDWFEDIRAGKVDEGRKEIAVKIQDEGGTVEVKWEFSEAWIKEYSPPELDASADGDMATESVTIAFDEMIRTEA